MDPTNSSEATHSEPIDLGPSGLPVLIPPPEWMEPNRALGIMYDRETLKNLHEITEEARRRNLSIPRWVERSYCKPNKKRTWMRFLGIIDGENVMRIATPTPTGTISFTWLRADSADWRIVKTHQPKQFKKTC